MKLFGKKIAIITIVVFFTGCAGMTAQQTLNLTGEAAIGAVGAPQGGGATGNFRVDARKFSRFLAFGTINLLTAVANMQEAVGNKKLADQIRMQAASLKRAANAGTASSNDYKRAFQTINESNIDRTKMARVPAARGRIYFAKSSIHLALGGVADAKAINIGTSLVRNPPSGKELLEGDIITSLNLANLAITTLPNHISKINQWTVEISNYMKNNNIPAPTEAEKKQAAKADGATSAEVDEMFGD